MDSLGSVAIKPHTISENKIILLSALLLIYIYYKFIGNKRRVHNLLKEFPGPTPWPILGNSLLLQIPDTGYNRLFQTLREKYGNTYLLWITNKPWVMLFSADNVGTVLSSTVHVDKSKDYDVFHPWFGNGIVSINGDAWRHRRKLLQPTYNVKRFEDFVKIANIHTTTLLTILENKCNQTFDISHYIKRCSLDIICEMATGTRKNIQLEPKCEYIQCLESNVEMMVYRLVSPWLHPEFVWNLTNSGRKEKKNLKILHGFTQREIAARRRFREENKNEAVVTENLQHGQELPQETTPRKLLVFIDYLLDLSERNKDYTDKHIQEDVDAFVFAGFDTTAQSMNFTLLLLASSPVHQKIVQEELDGIFGDDRSRSVTSQDLSEMKYLELCIKESLRLYPSGPYFLRAIHEDCKLDDGRVIPDGSTAFISAFHLHRDPDVFPNPEEFDPERFLPENCKNRHPYAYVPFANGPRNCMGQKMAMQEEKVVLSRILVNFNIQTKMNREKLVLKPTIILQVTDGFQLELTKRE